MVRYSFRVRGGALQDQKSDLDLQPRPGPSPLTRDRVASDNDIGDAFSGRRCLR